MILFQEATVAVNDAELYYQRVGQGPKLVLLHGFLGSHLQWKPYLEELAQDFEIIVPEFRGHGKSTNPSGAYTHRQNACDIYTLLDALEITHFNTVGFSSGGMTLLHMALQQPERIKAMSLWGTANYFPDECRAIQRKMTLENIAEQDPAWLENLRERHAHGDSQIRELLALFRQMADSYDDMNFTPPYLSTIRTPTLIVHGDRDQFFPVHIPVEMYQAMPNASLWILPNTDHNVFEALKTFSAEDPVADSLKQPFPSVVLKFLKEA